MQAAGPLPFGISVEQLVELARQARGSGFLKERSCEIRIRSANFGRDIGFSVDLCYMGPMKASLRESLGAVLPLSLPKIF